MQVADSIGYCVKKKLVKRSTLKALVPLPASDEMQGNYCIVPPPEVTTEGLLIRVADEIIAL